MPLQSKWITPEIFLRFRDVKIRRVYPNDYYHSPDPHIFAIVAQGPVAVEHRFDVRDLPGWNGQEPNRLLADLLRELIRDGVIAATGVVLPRNMPCA